MIIIYTKNYSLRTINWTFVNVILIYMYMYLSNQLQNILWFYWSNT